MAIDKLIDERPFAHLCKHGTLFKAARYDLRGGVTATVRPDMTPEQLMQDAAQFAGYHATNIHPDLERFGGYDTINITIQSDTKT
jgi:hypothetical protein